MMKFLSTAARAISAHYPGWLPRVTRLKVEKVQKFGVIDDASHDTSWTVSHSDFKAKGYISHTHWTSMALVPVVGSSLWVLTTENLLRSRLSNGPDSDLGLPCVGVWFRKQWARVHADRLVLC